MQPPVPTPTTESAPAAAVTAPRSAPRLLVLALGIVLLMLIGQVVGVGLASLIAQAAGADPLSNADLQRLPWPTGLLVFVAGELGVLAAGVAMAIATCGSLAAVGLRRRGTARALLATWPILLVTVALPVGAALGGAAHVFAHGVDAARVAQLALLTASIGLAEEVVFRGAVFERLGGARRPVLAIAGSAVLFGLVHLPFTDPSDMGMVVNAASVLLAVGIPFAVIRLVTGNLLGLAIAHALVDLVSLARLDSIEPKQPHLTEATVQLVGSLLLAVGYTIWGRSRWRRRTTG